MVAWEEGPGGKFCFSCTPFYKEKKALQVSQFSSMVYCAGWHRLIAASFPIKWHLHTVDLSYMHSCSALHVLLVMLFYWRNSLRFKYYTSIYFKGF